MKCKCAYRPTSLQLIFLLTVPDCWSLHIFFMWHYVTTMIASYDCCISKASRCSSHLWDARAAWGPGSGCRDDLRWLIVCWGWVSHEKQQPFKQKILELCWCPFFLFCPIWFDLIRELLEDPSCWILPSTPFFSPRLALSWNSAIAYGGRPSMKQGEMDGPMEVGPLVRLD